MSLSHDPIPSPAPVAPRFLGRERYHDREVFLLPLESPSEFPDEPGLSVPYACAVLWDVAALDAAPITDLASRLLRTGAGYVCTWGAGCERTHDFVDWEKVAREIDGIPPPEGAPDLVMTTWHDKDSLDEALDFVFEGAIPINVRDDSRVGAARESPVLIVVIGRPAGADGLSDLLREFVE